MQASRSAATRRVASGKSWWRLPAIGSACGGPRSAGPRLIEPGPSCHAHWPHKRLPVAVAAYHLYTAMHPPSLRAAPSPICPPVTAGASRAAGRALAAGVRGIPKSRSSAVAVAASAEGPGALHRALLHRPADCTARLVPHAVHLANSAPLPGCPSPKSCSVCIVTGGSRGIGAAIAIALGGQGARVVVNYAASAGKAEEVAAKIKEMVCLGWEAGAAGELGGAWFAGDRHQSPGPACCPPTPCRAPTSATTPRQGGDAIAVGADVSKREDLEALVKAATDKWGRLDVLVNNAGGPLGAGWRVEAWGHRGRRVEGVGRSLGRVQGGGFTQ